MVFQPGNFLLKHPATVRTLDDQRFHIEIAFHVLLPFHEKRVQENTINELSGFSKNSLQGLVLKASSFMRG